jgi:aspartyl-tRNA(Asn)/glutamyl-tRNA(Gln) amidotransferase subunit C
MKITPKDVDYVARLARLALTDEEKARYAGQLVSIFGYIDQLNALDTTDVPPTSHVLPLVNAWRADEARLSSVETRERILDNAPERDGDFFRVKKVIE